MSRPEDDDAFAMELEELAQSLRSSTRPEKAKEMAVEKREDVLALDHGWSSALAVSSLHKAYQRLKSDNEKLRGSLQSAEKRVMKLLSEEKAGGTSQQQIYQEKENRCLNLEEENKCLQNELLIKEVKLENATQSAEKLRTTITKLESELETALKASSDDSALAVMEESVSLLQASLDKTNSEKLAMIRDFDALQASSEELKRKFKRIKAISKEQQSCSKTTSARMLVRAITRMQQRTLSKTFARYRAVHLFHMQRCARLKTAITLGTKVAIGRTFRFWYRIANTHKRRCNALRSILLRLCRRNCGSAFTQLKSTASSHKSRIKLLLRLYLKRRKDMLVQAFSKLSSQYHQGLLLNERNRVAKLELERNRDAKSLQNLQIAMEKHAVKTLGKLVRNSLVGCFSAWKTYCQNRRQEKLACLRVLNRLAHKKLSFAYYRWVEFWQSGKEHDQVMAKAITLMCNRTKAGVMRAWKSFVAQRHQTRDSLLTLSRIVRKRILEQGYSRWRAGVERVNVMEEHARRMCLTLQNDDLRLRFAAWKEFTRNAKTDRADNVVVRRAAQRLMKRKLLILFTQWKNHVVHLVASRKAIIRVLQRLKCKKMDVAFKQWHRTISRQAEARQALSRLCSKLEKLHMNAAFSSLKRNKIASLKKAHEEVVNQNLELQRQLAETQEKLARMEKEFGGELSSMLERENALKTKYAQVVIARGEQQTLRYYFNHMRQQVFQARHQREVVRSCVIRIANRRLMQMFNSWDAFTAERKHVRQVATRVLGSLRLRSLSIAFREWRSTVVYEKRCDELVERARQQNQTRRLIGCFEAWRTTTRQSKAQNAVAMQMFLSLQKDTLTSTFMQWKMYTHSQKVKKQDKETQQQLALRAIEHLQQQCIARSFNSWVFYYSRRKEAKVKVVKLLTNATVRLRRRALLSWHRLTITARDQAEAMRKVIKCCYNRTLRIAMATWRSNVRALMTAHMVALEESLRSHSETIDSLRLESERAKDARLRRILASWTNRSLFKTFNEWKENARSQRRLREKSSRILQRFAHTNLARAFAGWTSFVSSRKEHRQLVHKVLLRLTCAKLTLAFDRWQEHTCLDAKLCEFVQKRTGYLAAKCFDALRSNCKTRREAKREVLQGLFMASTQRQSWGFHTWRLHMEAARVQEKYLQVLCVASAMRNDRAKQLKTFHSWKSITSKSKLRRCHLAHLLLSKGRNSKHKSVRQWNAIRIRARVLHRLLRLLHKDTLARAWGLLRLSAISATLSHRHMERLRQVKDTENSKAFALLGIQQSRRVLLVRLGEWRMVVTLHKHRRSRLRRLATAKWRGQLSLAWFRLVEHCSWEGICQVAMEGFSLQQRKIRVSRALHVWRSSAQGNRQQKAGARLVYSLLMRSLERRVSRALATWREKCILLERLAKTCRQDYNELLENCLTSFGEFCSAADLATLVTLLEKHAMSLAQTNHVRLFIINADGCLRYCAVDNIIPIEAGRGIAGRVATSGSSVMLMNALEDGRFDENVDGRQRPRSRGFDSFLPASRASKEAPGVLLGLVSVPILGSMDGEDVQVIGVLQASKFASSERSSVEFLEKMSKVLTMTSLFLSLKLEQFSGAERHQERYSKLLKSVETVEGETGNLRQEFVSELKAAKQRIASLERKCGRAERLETEIRSAEKALKRWDHLDRRRHMLMDLDLNLDESRMSRSRREL